GALAERLGLALRRLDESEEQLDRRALAGAVGSEQTSNRRPDLEVNVIERENPPVALRQPLRTQQYVHAAPSARPIDLLPAVVGRQDMIMKRNRPNRGSAYNEGRGADHEDEPRVKPARSTSPARLVAGAERDDVAGVVVRRC